MLSLLFWNIHKNKQIAPFVTRLAASYDIDLFLFAECPKDPEPLVQAMNNAGRGGYRLPDSIPEKVRVFTRLPSEHLERRFTGIEVAVWAVKGKELPKVLLAAVHLPAKSGGFDSHAQAFVASTAAEEIIEVENREDCFATVCIGDFNMNPYEPGMVMPECFHSLMTTNLAELPDRDYRGSVCRRFYNPMWGLFGDRPARAAGSFFTEAYTPVNHYWHMLDQVLVRPSLIPRLCSVEILAYAGPVSFLGGDGAPDRDRVSDHLPLLVRLAI